MRRLVPMYLCLLALAPLPVRAATHDPATAAVLLDYQESEELRNRLRRAVLHLTVLPALEPGFDPSFRPTATGAVTVVRLPDGREVFVAAAPLVRNAERLTIVREEGRATEARLVRELPDEGVVLLEPVDRRALGDLLALPLAAAPDAAEVGRTYFSLDNLASGFEVLFWGDIQGEGEPPLTALRVVAGKRCEGFPLVDATGSLLGVTFREVLPGSGTCFASTAGELSRRLCPPPEGALPAPPE